jgi:hypothetical protein
LNVIIDGVVGIIKMNHFVVEHQKKAVLQQMLNLLNLKIGEKMNRRLSNVEKITELMECSKAGAISQVIVLEAVRDYCAGIVAQERPEYNPHEVISQQYWWDSCKIVLDELNELTEKI